MALALVNGRLPSTLLAVIPGTGQRVRLDLLPQTVALRDAFKERFGKSLVVTDGYRDYDAQVRVKAAKGWLAATPGQSNHGFGRAGDFGSGVERFGTPEYAWMKANAPRFGWTHPAWAEPGGSKPEPWHWEATAVPVSNYQPIGGPIAEVPAVTAPAPVAARRRRTRGVTDMPIIYVHVGMRAGVHGTLAHNGGFVELASAEEKANLLAAGAKEVWVEPSTLANLVNDARGANDIRG